MLSDDFVSFISYVSYVCVFVGVYGPGGRGVVSELGLESEIFCRLHTYGKGFGCHGAAVVGSLVLTKFLMNYSKSFIYTTALPPHALLAISCVYDIMTHNDDVREKVRRLIKFYQSSIKKEVSREHSSCLLQSDSAVQAIIVHSSQRYEICFFDASRVSDRGQFA